MRKKMSLVMICLTIGCLPGCWDERKSELCVSVANEDGVVTCGPFTDMRLIEYSLDSPKELVWASFVEKPHIRNWLSHVDRLETCVMVLPAPRGFDKYGVCVIDAAELDLLFGGWYSFRIRGLVTVKYDLICNGSSKNAGRLLRVRVTDLRDVTVTDMDTRNDDRASKGIGLKLKSFSCDFPSPGNLWVYDLDKGIPPKSDEAARTAYLLKLADIYYDPSRSTQK